MLDRCFFAQFLGRGGGLGGGHGDLAAVVARVGRVGGRGPAAQEAAPDGDGQAQERRPRVRPGGHRHLLRPLERALLQAATEPQLRAVVRHRRRRLLLPLRHAAT